jgi:palmitoyltransferase
MACTVDVVLCRLPVILQLLATPVVALILVNMYGHYYWVTKIPPGTPSFSMEWDDSGSSWPWAVKRGAGPVGLRGGGGIPGPQRRWQDSPLRERREGERSIVGNVEMVEERSHSLGPITSKLGQEKKKVRRCRKCDGPKPDVGGPGTLQRFVRWLMLA